jgi:hypothetical protein
LKAGAILRTYSDDETSLKQVLEGVNILVNV